MSLKTKLYRALRSSLIFIIPGIVFLIKDHIAGAYLLTAGIAEIILGTIIPPIASFIEFAVDRILFVLKWGINIIITGLLQIIVFPIIRFTGLIFSKHFLDRRPQLKNGSYYKIKDNEWKDSLEEPF